MLFMKHWYVGLFRLFCMLIMKGFPVSEAMLCSYVVVSFRRIAMKSFGVGADVDDSSMTIFGDSTPEVM